MADNELESVPASIAQLTSLWELWLYGNQLTALPAEVLQCPALHKLWIEANPISSRKVEEVLSAGGNGNGGGFGGGALGHLGLDTDQASKLLRFLHLRA